METIDKLPISKVKRASKVDSNWRKSWDQLSQILWQQTEIFGRGGKTKLMKLMLPIFR